MTENKTVKIEKGLEPNITVEFGDGVGRLKLHLYAKKTPLNRLKYWYLCQFFPFKVRWL
jgi:hypothetical protein